MGFATRREYYVIMYNYGPENCIYVRENHTPLFDTKEQAAVEAVEASEMEDWDSYSIITTKEMFQKYSSDELKCIFWDALK